MSKLYVLVRKDLSWSQRVVQAGHAIAEFMKEHPGTSWDNGTLVVLGIKDLGELNYWWKQAVEYTSEISFFVEPDLYDEITAFAAHGDEVSTFFKNLPLL